MKKKKVHLFHPRDGATRPGRIRAAGARGRVQGQGVRHACVSVQRVNRGNAKAADLAYLARTGKYPVCQKNSRAAAH